MFESFFSLFDAKAAIEFIRSVPWYWVLFIAFFVTFIENLFPPSPSDVILLFTGTMISFGTVGFVPLLVCSTIGSISGFMLMYYLGMKFGSRVIDSGKLKFISQETLKAPERWFNKYGYYIIIANRFLAGTRAVISFYAGVSKLDLKKTTILSFFGALAWNSAILYLGYIFGNNFEEVSGYLSRYVEIVTLLILAVIIFFTLRYFLKRKKEKQA